MARGNPDMQWANSDAKWVVAILSLFAVGTFLPVFLYVGLAVAAYRLGTIVLGALRAWRRRRAAGQGTFWADRLDGPGDEPR